MQRVVFNAHYFAYCDDAIDTWFRSALAPDGGGFEAIPFDFMLKKAELVWHAPLIFGDTAALHCSVTRWGNSSFDISVDGRVGDDPRFVATITYVSVTPGLNTPAPIPQVVRDTLQG